MSSCFPLEYERSMRQSAPLEACSALCRVPGSTCLFGEASMTRRNICIRAPALFEGTLSRFGYRPSKIRHENTVRFRHRPSPPPDLMHRDSFSMSARRYLLVDAGSAWPKTADMVSYSMPASIMWVASEKRKVWGPCGFSLSTLIPAVRNTSAFDTKSGLFSRMVLNALQIHMGWNLPGDHACGIVNDSLPDFLAQW